MSAPNRPAARSISPDNIQRRGPPRVGPVGTTLTPRQRELLNHLEALFLQEGFAHLTIGELASRLRCSRRTLYEIAPNKDALVLLVIDRHARRLGRLGADRLGQIDDPAERIEAFLRAGSELHRSSVRFAEDLRRHAPARELFTAHVRHLVAVLQAIVDEGIERGVFYRVHSSVVSEIVDAALERFQDPRFLRESGITVDEATRQLALLLRHGLTAESSDGREPDELR